MKFTDLISANFSRKAELVIVVVAGISYVCGLDTVDAAILRWSILAIAWIGTLGVTAQAVIDFKHPRPKDSDMPVPSGRGIDSEVQIL